jgi:hypothetical protein
MSPELKPRIYSENIVRRDLPSWYELSWQEEPMSLIFKIHQDFINNSEPVPLGFPVIEALKKNLGLSGFEGDLSKDFGYENAFKNRGVDERGFVVLQAKIPEATNYLGVNITDWHSSYALSASLMILTMYAHHLEKETSSNSKQLFVLKTNTSDERYGLSGTISLTLHNWLKENKENVNKEMISAMKSAYQRMLGKDADSTINNFIVLQWENGAINAGCLKSRWGMSPHFTAESDIGLGYGYKIEGYNLDNPMQQITMVAGLAALHDCARKGMGQ